MRDISETHMLWATYHEGTVDDMTEDDSERLPRCNIK